MGVGNICVIKNGENEVLKKWVRAKQFPYCVMSRGRKEALSS